MVGEIDSRWNTIEASILTMHNKLVDLGFVYYNGEVSLVESQEEEKHV